MISGDTIAAHASCPGWSSRAIIRASGSAVRTIEAALLRDQRPSSATGSGPRGFTAEFVLVPGRALPVLACGWSAPNSYTGEDALEVYVPGNPHLVRRVLGAILGQPGVRLARPGEFSERAYWNGRLSLEQAEGLGSLLAARTRRDLDAARRVMSGAAGSRARALADEVAELLALIEAGIDFSDQDGVSAIAPSALRTRVRAAIDAIDEILGPAPSREASAVLPVVALAGPPNAGKSSLFNALVGRTRVAASPEPGTTRDAIVEPVELTPGFWAMLVDLPGLELDNPNDDIGVLSHRGAEAVLVGADLIICCDPEARFDTPLPPDVPRLVARTKADLGGDPRPALSVSIAWPESLANLRGAVVGALERSAASDAEPVLARHRESLALARSELAAALTSALGERIPGERVAHSLRASLASLGSITGRVHPDDLIGLIFRRFCVGK